RSFAIEARAAPGSFQLLRIREFAAAHGVAGIVTARRSASALVMAPMLVGGGHCECARAACGKGECGNGSSESCLEHHGESFPKVAGISVAGSHDFDPHC